MGGHYIQNIITQEQLIKDVARSEGIHIAAVRSIFKAVEDYVTDYLSSTTPTDSYLIKLLNGVTIESKYVPERIINKGMFENLKCSEKIKISSNVSRCYEEKINTIK